MRILITGGAGFIGSHLVERLLGQGHDVVVIDNFITGQKSNVETFISDARLAVIEHDITKPLDVEGPLNCIYNLACPASPLDYQTLPLETLLTSSLGTQNVLDLALAKGARFLHASTSEVYGDPLEHPQTESYWGNVDCIGPRSCYDEGKRYAESLIVHYLKKYNVEAKIIRIFNTYGPKMRHHDGRVIPNFIDQAMRGEPITIYGDGMQTRSFCYVDDMVDGLMAMMEAEDLAGPVNLGNPEEISIKALAETIVKLTGSKSRIDYRPAAPGDPKVRRPDITLAKERLGFKPKIGLEEGLKRTIEAFTP